MASYTINKKLILEGYNDMAREYHGNQFYHTKIARAARHNAGVKDMELPDVSGVWDKISRGFHNVFMKNDDLHRKTVNHGDSEFFKGISQHAEHDSFWQ